MGYAVKLQSAVKDRGIPIVWESDDIKNRTSSHRVIGTTMTLSKTCSRILVHGVTNESALASYNGTSVTGNYSSIRSGQMFVPGETKRTQFLMTRPGTIEGLFSSDGSSFSITKNNNAGLNGTIHRIFDISKAELIESYPYGSTYETAQYSVSVDLSKYRWVIIEFYFNAAYHGVNGVIMLNVPMHDFGVTCGQNIEAGSPTGFWIAVYVDENGFYVFNKSNASYGSPLAIYGIK